MNRKVALCSLGDCWWWVGFSWPNNCSHQTSDFIYTKWPRGTQRTCLLDGTCRDHGSKLSKCHRRHRGELQMGTGQATHGYSRTTSWCLSGNWIDCSFPLSMGKISRSKINGALPATANIPLRYSRGIENVLTMLSQPSFSSISCVTYDMTNDRSRRSEGIF